MKLRYVLMLVTSAILFTGCSDDDTATTSGANCTALMATMATEGEAYSAMFMGVMSGGEFDAAVCTSYAESLQAFLDGGCTSCGATDEACAEDGSNQDVCCDELTQESVDAITTSCANGM